MQLPKPPKWLTLGELLGSGGMGQVFVGTDGRTSERVAVKTLARFSGKELLCLKNEFRAFSNVVHPNLVAQHELVEADGQWFLLMELVDGKTLLEWWRGLDKVPAVTPMATPSVGRDDPTRTMAIPIQQTPQARQAAAEVAPVAERRPCPDLARLMPVVAQVVQVVDAIHHTGYLHRDLKPANVLVTSEGHVKVLDFGIAIARETANRESADPTVVVGTPAYIAPELLLGKPASPASDWYSVGCMLFELLAGQRPYVGPPLELFEAKLMRDVPDVTAFVADVPAWLATLTTQLLARTPDERPTVDALKKAFGVADAETTSSNSNHVVGREQELSVLLAQAAKATSAPSAVMVSGRSGVGKSALLTACIELLRLEGAVVLEGRCYEQEQVPYKTVDKLVDAFALEASHNPPWLEAVLPADREALGAAFPVLRDLLKLPSSGVDVSADSATLKRRALDALTELLTTLAKQVRLVCCVDDLQWGDITSAQALARLVRPGNPGVLLLLAHRAEDDAAPTVEAMREALTAEAGAPPQRVAVERLSPAQSLKLAEALAKDAGVTDTALIEWAQREANGEPFFLHELMFVAARDPALARSARGMTMQDVIQLRLQRLSDGARALFEVVCHAGHAVTQVVANTAVGNTVMAPVVPRAQGRALHSNAATRHGRAGRHVPRQAS